MQSSKGDEGNRSSYGYPDQWCRFQDWQRWKARCESLSQILPQVRQMSLHRRVKLCLYRKQWPAVGCRDRCYPHTGVAGPQLLPTRDSEAGRCPGWEFELLLTAGDVRDSKESQVRWTYNRWWSVDANLGPTFFRLGGDHSEGSLFTGRHTGDGRACTDSDLVRAPYPVQTPCPDHRDGQTDKQRSRQGLPFGGHFPLQYKGQGCLNE